MFREKQRQMRSIYSMMIYIFHKPVKSATWNTIWTSIFQLYWNLFYCFTNFLLYFFYFSNSSTWRKTEIRRRIILFFWRKGKFALQKNILGCGVDDLFLMQKLKENVCIDVKLQEKKFLSTILVLYYHLM